VIRAAARSMHVLAVLRDAPLWASASRTSDAVSRAPRDVDDFAHFAGAVAARYGTRGEFLQFGTNAVVDHWEIWNRPNEDTFWGCATPHDYAHLLAAGAGAIREADPDAIIISGGLTPQEDALLAPAAFVDVLYKLNVDACFDVVGLQPYMPGDAPPSDVPQTHLNAVEDVFTARGDLEVVLWNTEFGYREDQVSRDLQASYVTETFSLLRQGALHVVFWNAFRDVGGDTSGLLTESFERKPAAEAFATGRVTP
jgi:polysaccharide biosynthesis protein PslG